MMNHFFSMASTIPECSRMPGDPVLSGNAPPITAVVGAVHSGAWEAVGGIPLVARTLYHLNGAALKKVLVLLDTEKPFVDLGRWQKQLALTYARISGSIPATILSASDFHGPVLWIDACHLIDPRLLKALISADATTIAYMDPSDIRERRLRAGYLTERDLHRWAEAGTTALIQTGDALFPGDLDPFHPEVRGDLVPYFLEVRSKETAQKATRVLIKNQQKQIMDLPAEFIDPYFEDPLTLLLSGTPVTPNMVTLFSVVVAIGAAYLFWNGHFILGVLNAFIVEILDGVDGKLARTKLHFTRFGRYEALVDYFNENSWYVALAVGIGATVANAKLPVFIAALLILSDTADNIFYTLSGKWFGQSIDLFTPFDAAFRRIAGRRNIYIFIFLIGFLMGAPFYAFTVAAVWAAITASIHGIRLIQFRRHSKGSS